MCTCGFMYRCFWVGTTIRVAHSQRTLVSCWEHSSTTSHLENGSVHSVQRTVITFYRNFRSTTTLVGTRVRRFPPWGRATSSRASSRALRRSSKSCSMPQLLQWASSLSSEAVGLDSIDAENRFSLLYSGSPIRA